MFGCASVCSLFRWLHGRRLKIQNASSVCHCFRCRLCSRHIALVVVTAFRSFCFGLLNDYALAATNSKDSTVEKPFGGSGKRQQLYQNHVFVFPPRVRMKCTSKCSVATWNATGPKNTSFPMHRLIAVRDFRTDNNGL